MMRTLAVLALLSLAAAGKDAVFFETRIRPLLAKRCYSCHGQTEMAGLRLDSRENLLKGGSRGPAVVPGKPAESILYNAVLQSGSLKMPPSGKLDDASVGAIRTWVKDGAVWPEGPKGKPYSVSAEQKQWWAFQPVKSPAVPAVKNKAWVKSPVDSFILAALEAKAAAALAHENVVMAYDADQAGDEAVLDGRGAGLALRELGKNLHDYSLRYLVHRAWPYAVQRLDEGQDRRLL